MSSQRILSVGQCGFDHESLTRFVQGSLGLEIERAETATDALESIGRKPYDLILVNRVFDQDGDSGLEFIRKLKAEANGNSTPVMLVSNYKDAQKQAQEAGALPGFGKNDLGTDEASSKIRSALQRTV